MYSIEISQTSSVFNGVHIPGSDHGKIVGYTALTEYYKLAIPRPYRISIISSRNRSVNTPHYRLFPSSYLPEENLLDQLTFALKYEGVNLLVLKKIFDKIGPQGIRIALNSSSGTYVRRIWYLYEWLTNTQLKKEDADKRINYALLAEPKIQFTATKDTNLIKSERHRITNNLLGTRNFCPLVYVTEKVNDFQQMELHSERRQFGSLENSRILKRANAYLLLKDSKASFAIEGETPKATRLDGWAKAIGQAGNYPLTKEELIRLQQMVLPSKMQRRIHMGYRVEGGFIGDFEEDTNEPRPEHVSAKAVDLDTLMQGLIETNDKLLEDDIDAVVVAAIIAFGFVFIHPFVDGNGRIHRYIIHHILASKQYTPEGVIFPVSASIINHITKYGAALRKYSQPLLQYIEWETTPKKNVRVINDTMDYYRYFDATHLVEYLYTCIKETVEEIIPYEIDMLRKFDDFQTKIEDMIGLPDNEIKLLHNLLLQNNGEISKTKREDYFTNLTDEEILSIQDTFGVIHSTSDASD